MTLPHIALWVYIALLVGGGLAGYFKAGSRVSLIMALAFAVLLAFCNVGIIHPFWITNVLIVLLIAVFISRFVKTKKFMPAGMMIILSAAALGILVLYH